MGRVSQILKAKLTDEEFLKELQGLTLLQLNKLLKGVTKIRDECRGELRTAIGLFRGGGTPAEPEWFSRCKSLTNIRRKHMLMLTREIQAVEKREANDERLAYLEEEERSNAAWDDHWAEVDNDR